jgi:hypothetical protein
MMKLPLSSALAGFVISKILFSERGQNWIRKIINRKYNVNISIETVKLSLNRIKIIKLNFEDTKKEISLKAEYITVTFLVSFRGFRIKETLINNGEIVTLKTNVQPKRTHSEVTNQNTTQRLAQQLVKTIKRFVNKTPMILEFNNFKASIHLPSLRNIRLDVRHAVIAKGNGQKFDELNPILAKEQLFAMAEKDPKNLLSMSLESLQLRTGTDAISIESAQAQLNFHFQGGHSNNFQLAAKADNVKIDSDLFNNSSTVKLEAASLMVSGAYNGSGIIIDPISSFGFNKLLFCFSYDHPFSGCDLKKLTLKLNRCDFQSLLDSFPYFINRNIYTVKSAGGFGFEIKFQFKIESPTSHSFELKVLEEAVVKDFGKLDFEFLKYPFNHSIIEQKHKVGEIVLADTNPNFTSISNISKYCISTTLWCEDSDYYKHNGIEYDAIGFALHSNMVSGKFSRGGSTIVMQLIRNLFLGHQKFIYRKIEELMLTWLIGVAEIDKRRLLEIYFNIIEFGNGIHGIGAAAQYYFGKPPTELSLTESLVLSYVIPRPKFFHEALLDRSPQLISNLGKHLEVTSRTMLMNSVITYIEYRSVAYQVVFANDFGKYSLDHPTDNLHSVLTEVYFAALKLWAERYSHITSPFIICAYCANNDQLELYRQIRKNSGNVVTNEPLEESPHGSFPSLAFDIGFKDRYDQFDWSDHLFCKFAQIVQEIDVNKRVSWGGDFVSFKNICHFEMSEWKEFMTGANNHKINGH